MRTNEKRDLWDSLHLFCSPLWLAVFLSDSHWGKWAYVPALILFIEYSQLWDDVTKWMLYLRAAVKVPIARKSNPNIAQAKQNCPISSRYPFLMSYLSLYSVFVQTDFCTWSLNWSIRNLLEGLQSPEQGSCFFGFSLCMICVGLLVSQKLLSFRQGCHLDENGHSM